MNNPSCIDLIITNCYRFRNRYPKAKSRQIFNTNFNDNLIWYLQATTEARINFSKFQESFLHVLNIYAPMIKKFIRANEVPRFRLENIYHKSYVDKDMFKNKEIILIGLK